MPELGKIRRSRELGYKTSGFRIYAACVVCGRRRWVQLVKGKARDDLCHICSQKRVARNTRLCLLCHQYIAPGQGKKVSIHTAYSSQEGIVHKHCWEEYHTKLQTESAEKQRKSFISRRDYGIYRT